MKKYNPALNIMTSILLWFAGISSVLATNNCPNSTLKPLNGQQLIKGIANSSDQAIDAAMIQLNYQISNASVAEHYQQQWSTSSADLLPNTAKHSKNIQHNTGNNIVVQRQVKLLSTAQATGVIATQVLACQQGYVGYVLYDDRSLTMRIQQLLKGQQYRLVGPNYLVNSPLLKGYHNNQGKTLMATLQQSVEKTYYWLLLGNEKIKVAPAEMAHLITLPAKTSKGINLTATLSEQANTATIALTRDNTPNNTPIETTETIATTLFLCNQQGHCQTLATSATLASLEVSALKAPIFKPKSQTKVSNNTKNADIKRHTTTFTLYQSNNNKQQKLQVFAVNNALLKQTQLQKQPLHQQNGVYLTLLNLAYNAPEQTAVAQLN